jgi:hypothetical protein
MGDAWFARWALQDGRMFTGRAALWSVEQAISRARADEGRLDAALRSAIEEAARLRH